MSSVFFSPVSSFSVCNIVEYSYPCNFIRRYTVILNKDSTTPVTIVCVNVINDNLLALKRCQIAPACASMKYPL